MGRSCVRSCAGCHCPKVRSGARLEIGFYAKEGGKAQIAIQVNKLAKRADVDRERAAWKAALGQLQKQLEG
jgi:hypothetical protein